MGAGQSQPTETKTVFINENDVSDAYRTVGVSDEVVNTVQGKGGRSSSNKVIVEAATDPELAKELQRQRDENLRLRDEMARLSALQARKLPSSFGQDTRQDIEEKKKVFQESVDRVKQQFFGYQRENVCSDIEKSLSRCLENQKGKPLNCISLRTDYDNCVTGFRKQVLNESQGQAVKA